MFAFLRLFSAISFVVVIVAAIGLGWYFRMVAGEDLKMIVERNNVSLAQGFINTTWKPYRDLFKRLDAIEQNQWTQDPQFLEFSRDSFRYFEEIPVAKLNIYSGQLKRFLSTDQSEILISDAENTSFGWLKGGQESNAEGFARARAGQVFSRIIPDGAFKAPDGTIQKGSLIQTVIPVISDEYVAVVANSGAKKVEAVIEVFYDITPQWNQLYQFQLMGTSGIIGIFMLLLAALFYTSKRAELIIARKHDENLELTAAKARAEAESAEKSQFLANVSHELRTPLNAIIGFSEMMKNEIYGPVGAAEYVDYAKDINTSGQHLLSLITDILDFSKAEAGKLEFEFVETDATKIMKACTRLVLPRAESANVHLLEELPPEHVVITTDAKRLKQILLNLLSNAVKFTAEGGEVKLSAKYTIDGQKVMIQVKDTGIGISAKDISKAMSAFGQIESDLGRRYEGTGLGLPLTKKLVELMGGEFQIHSEMNVGTTISIILPLTHA